jgi:hypothetical protein
VTNSSLQELLDKRCKRSIAIILGVKEREADFMLPDDVQRKLRKVIIDQLNDFCSLATDILESASQGVVFNDLWLQKLDAIHEAVTKA